MMSSSLNINSFLSVWISLLLVVPSTAIMNNGLERNITQTQIGDEARKTDIAKAATIKRLAPVFYLKDKSLDGDALDLQNLTMGIAKKGETVTIIERRESMLKVRFDATDRIGWISQRVLSDL